MSTSQKTTIDHRRKRRATKLTKCEAARILGYSTRHFPDRLTCGEAAALLQINESGVRRLARIYQDGGVGGIKSEKAGRDWFFTFDAINAFIAETRGGTRSMRMIEVRGVRNTLTGWAEELGVTRERARQLANSGQLRARIESYLG